MGNDLKVELFYEKSSKLPLNTSRDLGYYEITGIPQAITKYVNNTKYNVTELPKVSLSFLLDANGVVDLVAATATFTEWVTEEKEVKSAKSKKEKDDADKKDEEDKNADAASDRDDDESKEKETAK